MVHAKSGESEQNGKHTDGNEFSSRRIKSSNIEISCSSSTITSSSDGTRSNSHPSNTSSTSTPVLRRIDTVLYDSEHEEMAGTPTWQEQAWLDEKSRRFKQRSRRYWANKHKKRKDVHKSFTEPVSSSIAVVPKSGTVSKPPTHPAIPPDGPSPDA